MLPRNRAQNERLIQRSFSFDDRVKLLGEKQHMKHRLTEIHDELRNPINPVKLLGEMKYIKRRLKKINCELCKISVEIVKTTEYYVVKL